MGKFIILSDIITLLASTGQTTGFMSHIELVIVREKQNKSVNEINASLKANELGHQTTTK